MRTFYPSLPSSSTRSRLIAFHAPHLGQAQFRLKNPPAEVVYRVWQFMHMTAMLESGASGSLGVSAGMDVFYSSDIAATNSSKFS